MRIALFGRNHNGESEEYIQLLVNKIIEAGCGIMVFESFFNSLNGKINFGSNLEIFNCNNCIDGKADYLFSIGGDGTILETITIIKDSMIPILGINTGRLGFLSSVAKEEICDTLDDFFNQKFTIESRTLLSLDSKNQVFGRYNYALNELTVYKQDTNSMITIHTYIDNEYLNSYWADGLIISTPTGSTGYSLSCGGPIVTPESEIFIITPIATHNLTVRPIIVVDNKSIKLKVESRSSNYLVSLDSRWKTIDNSEELIVKKNNFKINFVKIHNRDFYTTIRNKLMWGSDKRN